VKKLQLNQIFQDDYLLFQLYDFEIQQYKKLESVLDQQLKIQIFIFQIQDLQLILLQQILEKNDLHLILQLQFEF